MRVIVDEPAKGIFLPFALLGFESVFLKLSPNEIFFRDLQFLALGVTRQRDHLHPVAHRFRHAVDVIRGRDEDDL